MRLLLKGIISLSFVFSVSVLPNIMLDRGDIRSEAGKLLAAGGIKGSTKIVIAIFKDINAYEGSVSLIFRDTAGKEIWFSHFDINISSFNFYKTEYKDGAVIPQYWVNKAMQGKKFKITYREEEKEMEYSGEVQRVPVIVSIDEIRQ